MSRPTKLYNKIMEKYSLPSLKDLEKEFNFELDEDEENTLKFVFEKAVEMMVESSRILELSIFTSHDPSKLYEVKMAKDKREELFQIYKKLMSLCWEGRKVSVISEDKAYADYIKKVYDEWTNNSKGRLIDLFNLFEKEWKNVEMSNNNHEALYYG